MNRSWCTGFLVFAAAAAAQTAPATYGGVTSALKVVAAGKSAAWSVLNNSLESQLAALNPCDSEVHNAILGVSDASTARIDAWRQYVSARLSVTSTASSGVQAVSAALPQELKELAAERGEIQRGTANVEVQKTALDHAAATPGIDLRAAQNILDQLHVLAAQRAVDKTQREVALDAAADDLRKSTPGKAAADGAAAERVQQLITSESELWAAYYEARWVRAQIDCVAGGAKPRRRER